MPASSRTRDPSRSHVHISIRSDASPERPPTPLPDLRTNPASAPLASRSSLHPSPRPHSRTASTSPSPSLARWRDTLATQLDFIQRRAWPRALLGRTAAATRGLSPARQADRSPVEQALRRGMQGFAALWVAQDDDAASAGPSHLHGDDDLVPSSPALGSSSPARAPRPGGGGPQRIPPLSRLGQLVVVFLFLLGLRELVSGPSRLAPSRRARTSPPPVKGRNPFAVLSDLAPPASFSKRYSTHLPGSDSLWKTSAAPVDAFTDARDAGDTTAIVLHWKRTDNVGVIVAHLCQYTFFETVLVWNNNPDVVLSPQTFAKSRCPAGKLRIYNSPRNLFFLARYLACAHSTTPHCFFQDDDWVVQPLRALYSQFSRDPEGPVVVHTSREVATLYGLEWCFYNNPLHTCFAWVGTGAFTSRAHVERFLALTGSGDAAYGRDELAHADNSFTTMLNEPPYVLQSALAGLPSPGGHSDGAGIARNKAFIWQGVARLSSHLNLTFPPAPPPASPLTALSLPPLSSPPHHLSPSPPLPAHPHAHHARAPCTPTDACTFVTNLALLPPPDSARFPGVAAVGEGAQGLQRWEEHLGHVARGWKEGGERWSAEEDWAREWAYEGAVDGELGTVFRSPDVVRTGDYLALGLLEPLDAAWTPRVTLHVILAHADEVLKRVRVEVSGDGYRWVRPSTTPLRWTCRRAPLAASRALTPPDLPFPDSVLLSPAARRALERARADDARRGAVARWFARQARRRTAGSRECEVEVGAGMPVGARAGAGEGAGVGQAEGGGGGGGVPGTAGWRFVRLVVPATQRQRDEGGTGQGEAREVLDVGWAVAEMWLAAARARR
ncbi:hypothetical protein JCM9279_006456 [Rhodotorula babjevae]